MKDNRKRTPEKTLRINLISRTVSVHEKNSEPNKYGCYFDYHETKFLNTNFKKGVLSLMKLISDGKLPNYDLTKFEYLGNNIPSQVTCLRCGNIFFISAKNIKVGKGCGNCNYKETIESRKTIKQQDIISKCIETHGSKFDYSKVKYEKANFPITIICKQHSYEFNSTYMIHLSSETGGCHKCKIERLAKLKTIHGKRRHPLYTVWSGIKARCFNPNNPAYKNYGGRGISMGLEWLNFEVFYNWAVQNGFSKTLQIDRIDNNKGYNPDNCRFVTCKKNNNNRRTNTRITIENETKTLQEWCEQYSINPKLVVKRKLRGWSFEKAILEPVSQQNKRIGRKKSRLFDSLWSSIKNRCNNPNSDEYKNYGARGIKMCDEWARDYKKFENWCLKNGHKKGLELNRIDNDKGYSPENCNFVTQLENAQNKRSNNYLTYNGITKTMSQLSREVGLKRETIKARLERGWSTEEALIIPVGGKRTL